MEKRKLSVQYVNKEKTIFYNDKIVVLTDDIQNTILELLPPYWHTDADTLELFEYYDDGTYFCERKKEFYDYRSKDTRVKYYTYPHATLDQAKELYDILCDAYEKARVLYLQSIKDEVKQQLLQATGVIKQNIKFFRLKLLSQSDWSVLPDVTHPEGEKELWLKYRQYLRDMSSDTDWENNPLNIKIPLDPQTYKTFYPNQESEYLTKDTHFENPIASRVKEKLLQFVRYICLPSVKENINFSSDDVTTIKQTIQDGLYKIDSTLVLPEIIFADYESGENYFNNQTSQNIEKLIQNIEVG